MLTDLEQVLVDALYEAAPVSVRLKDKTVWEGHLDRVEGFVRHPDNSMDGFLVGIFKPAGGSGERREHRFLLEAIDSVMTIDDTVAITTPDVERALSRARSKTENKE